MLLEKRKKRQQISCWLLLALLIYGIVSTLIAIFTDAPVIILYFCPMTFLNLYLQQFFTPAPWLIGLTVLPLLGWLLCKCNQDFGKFLIIYSQVILLGANVFVTSSHFILALWMKSSEYLSTTVLFAICPLIYSVLMLALTNKWKPTINQ